MAQQTGAIYHQGILYSGGSGTNVTPNPQGEATDTLNTVEIDGTVYDIEGGGGSNLILDAQRYSLDEQVVGIWIDGKPLYQKTVACGALPNNTTKTIAHGISNIDFIANGWGYSDNGSQLFPIPFTNNDNVGSQVMLNITRTDITLRTSVDRSSFTKTYVTIQYTKTTDTAGSGGYQAYGFSPIIYSDIEREIGVWRDNKPLYQKTINIGAMTIGTSWVVTPHQISDIDTIAFVYGQAKNSSDGRVYYLPHYRPTRTDGISISADATNVYYLNNWIAVKSSTITVQYTKTTDVAGSGEYNTLAIPNVHYSTDEQVIGTWIDGKTLYQKTKVILFNELTHQGNLYYTQFRETGENVVDVKAKAVSTSYGMCYLGCKNYTTNNSESYWELIMYYNNICLKFTGATATDTNVSTITVTYQYTKTT